jgi:hypothetical protein
MSFAQVLEVASVDQRRFFLADLYRRVRGAAPVYSSIVCAADVAGVSANAALQSVAQAMVTGGRVSDILGMPELVEWEDNGDVLGGLRAAVTEAFTSPSE